jgi:hypothetical protein
VQPATLIRWHRQAFRLVWWWAIPQLGATPDPCGPKPADPGDGTEHPDLGRAALCGGAAREVGPPGVAAVGAALYAEAVTTTQQSQATGAWA